MHTHQLQHMQTAKKRKTLKYFISMPQHCMLGDKKGF